ncbi:hypothetical protein NL676_000882, partial [Syzygium grande]
AWRTTSDPTSPSLGSASPASVMPLWCHSRLVTRSRPDIACPLSLRTEENDWPSESRSRLGPSGGLVTSLVVMG